MIVEELVSEKMSYTIFVFEKEFGNKFYVDFRSSVCRSSIVDKESSFKLKDKELEKIEIRKQASEPLPSIPATPATPPEDDLGFHIVSTGGKVSRIVNRIYIKRS